MPDPCSPRAACRVASSKAKHRSFSVPVGCVILSLRPYFRITLSLSRAAAERSANDRQKPFVRSLTNSLRQVPTFRLLFANSVGRARERDRRQVFGHKCARPPAMVTWFREAVSIPICANKFWRGIGERVVCKQPKDSLFVFEHSLDKREEPRVQVRRRHGGEPHLPIELPMVRRHDARRTIQVAGFSLELVFAPLS